MPVSAEEAATPVKPPRSEVPSVDEESPQPPDAEPPRAGIDAGGEEPNDAPTSAVDPNARRPGRSSSPEGGDPEPGPAADPARVPAPEPPEPGATDDNLFKTSATRLPEAPASRDGGIRASARHEAQRFAASDRGR